MHFATTLFNEAIALSTTKVMRNICEQNYTVLTEIKTNTGLQVCIMNVHVQSYV